MSKQVDTGISYRSYYLGFGLSLVFTLTAYFSVSHHWFGRDGLIGLVVVLALAQFMAQLIYFLHISHEAKPRWKLLVFYFMILVVLILVLGSLWIMNNLNYHMTPQKIQQYLQNQDGGI